MTNTWPELSENLAQAHQAFIDLAHQLDVTLRTQAGVCGAWSPQDIVAHLAGWDAEAVRGFRLFAAGKGAAYDIGFDVDTFNARSVGTRQHLPWKAVIDELRASQRELQDLIAVVHSEGLNPDGGFGRWLVGRRQDYEQHTGQLQAWVSIDNTR